jgi:hypothetical protein
VCIGNHGFASVSGKADRWGVRAKQTSERNVPATDDEREHSQADEPREQLKPLANSVMGVTPSKQRPKIARDILARNAASRV